MSYLAILQYASDSYVLFKNFSFNDKYLKQFLSSDNIYYYFLLCSIYYLLSIIPFSICFMDVLFFGSQMTMMMSNHYLKISHLLHLKSGIS